MVHEHEADPVLVRRRPSMIPLMPSPGQSEDRVDAPFGQSFDQDLGCDLCHLRTSN